MNDFIDVYVPKSAAFVAGKVEYGTIVFPVDPSLLLELRPWERTWLAENLNRGSLPHGVKGGKWKYSPIQADPLWHDGSDTVSRQQVASLIRDRMRICIASQREHEVSVQLCSQWLARFKPHKLTDLHSGRITTAEVAELRAQTLLRADQGFLLPFIPIQASSVGTCCEEREIKFASAPLALDDESVSLPDEKWDCIFEIQSSLSRAIASGPWMDDTEFGPDDLWLRLRCHSAWCNSCDSQRQHEVRKIGLVASLSWGPMTMEREYELRSHR